MSTFLNVVMIVLGCIGLSGAVRVRVLPLLLHGAAVCGMVLVFFLFVAVAVLFGDAGEWILVLVFVFFLVDLCIALVTLRLVVELERTKRRYADRPPEVVVARADMSMIERLAAGPARPATFAPRPSGIGRSQAVASPPPPPPPPGVRVGPVETPPDELPDDVPDAYLCPIVKDLMIYPVICSDGHSYERAAIETWLRSSRRAVSPKTGQPLPHRNLVPNHALRNAVLEWREKRGI